MAKIVFICFKDGKQNPYCEKDIDILSKRLTPDNVPPRRPLVINKNGIFILIFNYRDCLPIENTSVCMGNLINPTDDWWRPTAEIPEGGYALFRSDEDTVELVTDEVGSRTIWYVQAEDMFIAATSQRLIVSFLGDFELNRSVFPWVLSAGILGPELSWDKRIKQVGSNTRVLLDRSSFKISIKREYADFTPSGLTEKEYEIQLNENLEYVFEHLGLDPSRWVLTLSGGYDSRAILYMLKNRENLKCVTWGLRSSLDDKNKDTYIAKLLAGRFSLHHTFFETDISTKESVEKIFNRYLAAGEGRVDGIAGYMSGFIVWKALYERPDVFGIIRGDEGFGWKKVNSALDIRNAVGASFFSDYPNLKNLEEFGLEKQFWPDNLCRREKESLATWRDRLYHEFRIPIILAAFNDVTYSYLELVNPLLSRKIIRFVRELPDSLRTGKKLFKKIVRPMFSEIGFAKYDSLAAYGDIFRVKQVVGVISNELDSSYGRALLSDKLVEYILSKMEVSSEDLTKDKTSLKMRIQYHVPIGIKNVLRNTLMKQQMDHNILAYRAYTICKMNKMLSEDAAALKQDQ